MVWCVSAAGEGGGHREPRGPWQGDRRRVFTQRAQTQESPGVQRAVVSAPCWEDGGLMVPTACRFEDRSPGNCLL